MKDSGKFLFLDPVDAVIPSAVPSREDEQSPETVSADMDARQALGEIVDILSANGYNPVVQLTGYLMAEDPTYLPEDTDARAIARRITRDKLLETLIELYLEHRTAPDDNDS